ncbi:hypothetical protein AX15_003394 [Amanita polypyramis BW_CC]|nr:hypothetical protein AX15_003394 [Amanita polypyramis BW_CC]
MGISRSATVVAAYLMKSKRMDAASAIRFIRHRRPQAHPNYGFITQLVTFSSCEYDPCPENPTYRAWKRKQKQNITAYLSHITDTTWIIPDKLLVSSCFPTDPVQAEALIYELGVTHLLTISPCKIPPTIPTSTSLSEYRHFSLSNQKSDLLIALPDACSFIRRGIDEGGVVLVHCLVESRACTTVCAALMEMKNMSPKEASGVLEDALPLFNFTRNFSRHLELFAACGYKPTREHYLVQNWNVSQDVYESYAPPISTVLSQDIYTCPSSCCSSTVSSPSPSTPSSSVSSRTSSASSFEETGPLARAHVQAQAQAQVLVHGLGQGQCECQVHGSLHHKFRPDPYAKYGAGDGGYLIAKAMELLSVSETKFDLGAFGRALAAIQESKAREEMEP